MATNVDKILDIISKVATIQQVSTTQQPSSTQEPSNANAAPSSSDKTKYIYIGKDELNAIFPGLGDKLDVTRLLSALFEKLDLGKILTSSGLISIKPIEKNNVQPDEGKNTVNTEVKDEIKKEDNGQQ